MIDFSNDDCLLTIKEVSQILKVNVNKVYELISNGKLKALKLGSMKVRKVTLMKFLAEFDGMDLSDLENIKGINDPTI